MIRGKKRPGDVKEKKICVYVFIFVLFLLFLLVLFIESRPWLEPNVTWVYIHRERLWSIGKAYR